MVAIHPAQWDSTSSTRHQSRHQPPIIKAFLNPLVGWICRLVILIFGTFVPCPSIGPATAALTRARHPPAPTEPAPKRPLDGNSVAF